MREVLMGIDAGTGGVRVGLFDTKGNEIIFASSNYTTSHPKTGWAEQLPSDWWKALITSTRKALSQSNVKKEEIVGISYDATSCSVIACQNDGTPIRNPLIWMDIRASKEADFIRDTRHPILKMSGYDTVSPEWMPCKALWIKNNEPENYQAADKIVEFADWMTYKLTGKWTLNICNITTRWYYNRDEGGFPIDFYEEIGLGDIFDKFPKEIFDLGEHIGGLSQEAADALGLLPGTPIGQGGVDAFVGLLGLGVNESGKLGLITGSSHLLMGLTNESFNGKGMFGAFPDAVIKDLKMIEGGQISTGSIIKWFLNNFCQDLINQSKTEGKSVYDYLTPLAEKLPVGSEGLVVLDYWQGNRTPYVDPNVRGMIYGLSLEHRREHMFRAIIEGIALGTELTIQTFRDNGFPTHELYVAGGATNSELFLQIHADVSNLIINVPTVAEASTLGSAILASVASGIYTDIPEAVDNMVTFRKRIVPNQENHDRYKAIFEQYRKIYPEFKEWMHETSFI